MRQTKFPPPLLPPTKKKTRRNKTSSTWSGEWKDHSLLGFWILKDILYTLVVSTAFQMWHVQIENYLFFNYKASAFHFLPIRILGYEEESPLSLLPSLHTQLVTTSCSFYLLIFSQIHLLISIFAIFSSVWVSFSP